MEQLSEFVLNNMFLFAGLALVLGLLIKAELDHQTNKGSYLTPTMAIRLMNNDDETLVIDVRSVAEYKAGHINGSKNVPLNDFANKLNSLSGHKGKSVLIYCNSGTTATRAIKLLKKGGFEKVNNLSGGIAAWKEANMPLSTK